MTASIGMPAQAASSAGLRAESHTPKYVFKHTDPLSPGRDARVRPVKLRPERLAWV